MRDRNGHPVPLDFSSPPDLTDEDWARRDAEVAAKEAAFQAERARVANEARCRNLVDQGVPVKDIERATTGDVVETKAIVAVKAALERISTLVVLSGPRGCGKTTAATWWLMQPRQVPRFVTTKPVRFTDAPTLARWPRYDDGKMRELERAIALVIDDLGMEYDDKQGAFRSFLDGLVNARYAMQLPTVITTNLPVDDFKERYGERIADRIREAGSFVGLAGDSLRGRK